MNPALGIPDRAKFSTPDIVENPTPWNFVIHEHNADKAGLHYDLRLVDPRTGVAHSWAIRNLPNFPGDKTLAVQQPDHTEAYTKFEGVISDGYGKGTVRIYKSGKIEVLKSTPNHIRFNMYEGTRSIRFSLINTGGVNWLFFNHTPTSDNKPYIPRSKPSFKSIPPDTVSYTDRNQVLAPKIDGAANIFDLRGPHGVDTYSYRPSKKSTEFIDHTYRVGTHKIKLPSTLSGTTLMGEVYARDKDGRALPSSETTGALVANVWKAREKVPDFGIATYDVLRYKGKPYSDQPYSEKLRILQEIAQQVPQLSPPPLARTPEEKRKLLARVSFKQHPLTEEGYIVYNLDKPIPQKAKFMEDYDVYIQEILPGQPGTRLSTSMGTIGYSITPGGPVVGYVGGGFSDQERADIWANPKRYIGKPIRVYGMGQSARGTIRSPQFKDFRTGELFPK
jgi:hypothetical protein